jgi:glycosyltransferase involved in cell wall biosynthesis
MRAYPRRHRASDKSSASFALDLVRGLVDSEPVAIRRFHSSDTGRMLAGLIGRERFDRAVVDFLNPAAYFPDLPHSVLFQHNVETMIWRRHAQHAKDPLRRWYLRRQADRMFEFERRMCRSAGHIVAVSEQDAAMMKELFGVERVSAIPTGVDIESFTPPNGSHPRTADLVFVGSMDWLPNIDGVTWFVREVLPLIRRARPRCSLAIAGRSPQADIRALAAGDPLIQVTGTVPRVHDHLWGADVSIVPLRIGGGTRLKIYESMAARVPVVSTSVGAEGLAVRPQHDIRIADTPEEFASACVSLLSNRTQREAQAGAAWDMVRASFSWEQVARCFDDILKAAPALHAERDLQSARL